LPDMVSLLDTGMLEFKTLALCGKQTLCRTSRLSTHRLASRPAHASHGIMRTRKVGLLPLRRNHAMTRTIILALSIVAAASIVNVAAAQPISRNNPYRSFNISGVNYGSQRWEREHRGSSYRTYRPQFRFIHRR
jgi:hypothetical protein